MPEADTAAAPPRSGAELLKQSQPTRAKGHAYVCLRPDLLDAWEDAQEALSDAQDEATERQAQRTRIAGGATATRAKNKELEDLAKKVQDIEDQLEAAQIRFDFVSMHKFAWQALTDQHPPRPDNAVDMFAGYNRAAVDEAAIRACLVDPVFVDCEDPECVHEECGTWQQMLAFCNPSEWQELKSVVSRINGAVSTPKSRLASQILAKGAGTSKQRGRGA